jgi:Ca2+-binding RTX toxin-like protein
MATINGTERNDFLFGTDEGDFMHGREGHDELRGGGGNDTIHGGEGNDTLAGDDWGAPGELGDDLLIGGEGNDWFAWIAGNDTMLGGDGDDSFFLWWAGGSFDDVVVAGGEGVDLLEFIGAAPVTAHLGEGTLSTTFQGVPATISLQSIEDFSSRIDSDVNVTGSAADNRLETGNGNDTLNGGEGRDFLWGSSQNDLYVFDVAPGEANADFVLFEKYTTEIHGFEEADRIALDNDVMDALGAEGDFSADDERFYAAAGATAGAEEDDRVIYDTASGNLYYDVDGSGAAEARIIATLSIGGMPADLAASDITVI